VLFSFASTNTRRTTGVNNETQNDKQEPDLEMKPYGRESSKTEFDMILSGSDTGERMSLSIRYSTELFRKETIEKFIEYFKEIISALAGNEFIKLNDIKMSHDLGVAMADIYQSDETEFEF
jgi:hypothetical protein